MATKEKGAPSGLNPTQLRDRLHETDFEGSTRIKRHRIYEMTY